MPLYDCGAPDCEECQRAFGPDRSKAIANYHDRERAYAELERAANAKSLPPSPNQAETPPTTATGGER